MGRPPSWNDDQLRAAVAVSTSMKEVVARLRAVAGGAGHRAVSVRIEVLDLDTSHFGIRAAEGRPPASTGPRSRRRRWSDEDLTQAVAGATSLYGVFQALGLVVGGHQWLVIRSRIDELGLETSHWRRPLHRSRPPTTWTDEDLVRELPGCRSVAELLRRLGAPDTSGSQYRKVKARVAALDLDTSDLRGQGWAKGVPNPSGATPMPLEEFLVEGTLRHGRDLKRRLLEEGLLEARCASCGLDRWLQGPIPLEVDHINGDRRDNRIQNLRLLCPNCHALTETYRGRNIGRYADEPPAEG